MPPRHPAGPKTPNKANKNTNKKIVQANIRDYAQTETFHLPNPIIRPGRGKFIGTNADDPNRTLAQFNFSHPKRNEPGVWTNRNGVQIGVSDQEDSIVRAQKSTGDMAPAINIHLHTNPQAFDYKKAAKLRNKKYRGKGGY